jgi:hypothetical protein
MGNPRLFYLGFLIFIAVFVITPVTAILIMNPDEAVISQEVATPTPGR